MKKKHEELTVKDAAGRDVTVRGDDMPDTPQPPGPDDVEPSAPGLGLPNGTEQTPADFAQPRVGDRVRLVHRRIPGQWYGRVVLVDETAGCIEVVVDIPSDAPQAIFGRDFGPVGRLTAWSSYASEPDDDTRLLWLW